MYNGRKWFASIVIKGPNSIRATSIEIDDRNISADVTDKSYEKMNYNG